MSTELTTPIKIEIPGIGTIESADLYLKSEADKVIAHNKCKRCLAMAERYEIEYKLARYLTYNSKKEIKAHKRWQKWLELAEKFKPNSTAQ